MKRLLIIGATEIANEYINIILNFPNMKIIAVVDEEKDDLSKIDFDHSSYIPISSSVSDWLDADIDFVLETTGNRNIIKLFHQMKTNITIIPRSVLQLLLPFVAEWSVQINNLELILNNIRDGLIVVNNLEKIQFINDAACEIIGVQKEKTHGSSIKELIKNSRLPNVLQNQRKEVNQKLNLTNGKQIISTRVPLINDDNRLVGAFALFKDSHEVIRLAEENTDIQENKTMLEAIIHSSDEAISVVDEKGKGLIINPAYTRITGITEKEVLGKPATVDISEGESMHLKVLRTRRPVRG